MMAADFSAHAAKVHVHFTGQMTEDQLRKLVESLMSKVALNCVARGTRLIGHVKCIAEVEKEKYLACSVVGHDGKARCSGGLGRPSDRLDLIINVLQYGLRTSDLEEIVRMESMRGFGDSAQVSVETIGKEETCAPRPIQLI